MRLCHRFLTGYLPMRIIDWYGRLLLQLTLYGYRLHLLTPRQTVRGLSYSNTISRQALARLRIIREQREVNRLKRRESAR